MDWNLVMLGLSLAYLIFTIYMVIDANKRIKDRGTAFIVIVLILISGFGAIVWYFLRKRRW